MVFTSVQHYHSWSKFPQPPVRNYPDADRIYPVRPYDEKPMHFVHKRDAMRLHDSEYASFKNVLCKAT